MTAKPIDLSPLVKALAQLQEALRFWHELPQGAALKPHLRSAVIQLFQFTYELSVRMLGSSTCLLIMAGKFPAACGVPPQGERK